MKMELEKAVINALEEKGYCVYFRNISLKYNQIQITEYDVISKDFIIEVKSGKDFKYMQIIKQLKYLPDGYKLYYYIPNKDDEEVKKLNTIFKEITIVNNLEEIYKKQKTWNEFNICNRKDFKRVLSLPLSKIKIFDKLNILEEDFYFVYFQVLYVYDYYCINEEEKIHSSKKIEYLLDTGKINFVKEFDKDIPLITNMNIKNFIELEMHDSKINFLNVYNIEWNKRKIKKIRRSGQIPPLRENVTKICNQCDNVTFKNLKYCDDCYKKFLD
jgi:hypothetical protein